jgi:hypothetical protein
MIVAIGPVFLLLASVLLGAVILLAGFGIILLISSRQRRTFDRTGNGRWQREPPALPGQQNASTMVSPGK